MTALLQRFCTSEQFFAWADAQEVRYEFDGARPEAMTGGTVNHALVMRNLHRALDAGLRASPCHALGPDAGMAAADSIRYPDALITCATLDGTARIVPAVIAAFEIVSQTSGRIDRIVKVREYATITTLRRYIIIESTEIGALLLHRADAPTPGLPRR